MDDNAENKYDVMPKELEIKTLANSFDNRSRLLQKRVSSLKQQSFETLYAEKKLEENRNIAIKNLEP